MLLILEKVMVTICLFGEHSNSNYILDNFSPTPNLPKRTHTGLGTRMTRAS